MVQAIKSSGNSTAHGPDDYSHSHLKHLESWRVEYLRSLANLSLCNSNLPAVWEQATIIGFPKNGKPLTTNTSYRSISLLSPALKILERLLLPALQKCLPFAEHQHGFRSGRLNISALLPLLNPIATGFIQPKPPSPSINLAIDFSEAFDTIDHEQLMQMLYSPSLHHNNVRWLCDTWEVDPLAVASRILPRSCWGCGRTGAAITPQLFNAYVQSFSILPNSLHHTQMISQSSNRPPLYLLRPHPCQPMQTQLPHG